MTPARYLFILLNLPAFLSFAQLNEIKVAFKVYSPGLIPSDSVFITGNQPALGFWNPGRIAMTNYTSGYWEKTFQFQQGTLLEYKFTRGTWDTEALDSAQRIYPNFVARIRNDTVLTHLLPFWKSGTGRKVAGQITGTVAYHRNISGDGLRGRDIIVWLPPEYNDYPAKKYPVLYMHDGQNLFDPKTSAFGTDWRIDEAADSLIKAGIIKPLIIVGIYNTPDRGREYFPGEMSERYMKFVVQIVKPLIDLNYRTKPGRRNTSTGGSSAGGLIAFMLHNEYNNVWGKAICMSPAFKIENKLDYVTSFKKSSVKNKRFKVYLDNGGLGLEEQLQPGIDEMLKIFEIKGLKEGKDYFWVKNPSARHNEYDWGKRMPYVLKLLFGMK